MSGEDLPSRWVVGEYEILLRCGRQHFVPMDDSSDIFRYGFFWHIMNNGAEIGAELDFCSKKDELYYYFLSNIALTGESQSQFNARSRAYLDRAAQMGYPPAIFSVALELASPIDGGFPDEGSFELFKRAADLGHADSMWHVGTTLLNRDSKSADGIAYLKNSVSMRFEYALIRVINDRNFAERLSISSDQVGIYKAAMERENYVEG